MNKREIEEQAIAAFTLAVSRGYITSKSSEKEVRDNAYEILEFMPDYLVGVLSEVCNQHFSFSTCVVITITI